MNISTLLSNTETVIGEDELKKKVSEGKKLKVKFGVDPTRPDLTFGHLVVFNKLKQFQDAGHETILLIGDYAKGIDSGNIEVFLVGKDLNFNYISKLEEKIENLIGRKVSFYLSSSLPTNQFHIKLYSS